MRDEVLALPLFEPGKHKRRDNEELNGRIQAFMNSTKGMVEQALLLVRALALVPAPFFASAPRRTERPACSLRLLTALPALSVS